MTMMLLRSREKLKQISKTVNTSTARVEKLQKFCCSKNNTRKLATTPSATNCWSFDTVALSKNFYFERPAVCVVVYNDFMEPTMGKAKTEGVLSMYKDDTAQDELKKKKKF